MLHNANCIVFMQEELKAQLKAGLASLPAPSNDFEIVLPEVRCFSFFYCTHTWVMFSAVEISLKYPSYDQKPLHFFSFGNVCFLFIFLFLFLFISFHLL